MTFEQIQANVTEPHAPTELDPTREPILEVENLRMYFPVKSGGLIRRTIGHVQAVDGISFEVPGAARSGWWASRAAASRRRAG